MRSRITSARFVHDRWRDGASPVDDAAGCGSVGRRSEQGREGDGAGSSKIPRDGESSGDQIFLGGAKIDFGVGLIVVQRICVDSGKVVLQSQRTGTPSVRQRIKTRIR